MPTFRESASRATTPALALILAAGLSSPAPAQTGAPEDEIAAVLGRASLEAEPNPVVLELLLAEDLHRLPEEQRELAEEQVIEGLRDRAMVTAFDSLNAMMGSTKDVLKAQFKPKNLLRNALGGDGGGQSEANRILGEAAVGPWVRGLAAAGSLAEAGYVGDASAFYQRCLGEPLLASTGDGQALGAEFGGWVRARCERSLVDLGVEVAGPVFADLAAGRTGDPMTEREESAAVARASGLAGLGALLERGELGADQRAAVVDTALAVLDQPKKALDDALASAAARVLGTTGDPRAREALLDLADRAKSGRFGLPRRGPDLEGAARAARLALARGFDHQASLDQLRDELLGGRVDNPWDAFETLFAVEEPAAMTWARQQLGQLRSLEESGNWAEPVLERLGQDGGPLSLEALQDAEPATAPNDAYVAAKLSVTLFENGERERLPELASAIERQSWNLGGSAVKQGARMLKPLAVVAARHVLGLPIPQGPSERMLIDFAFGAADLHDRQQEAEAVAVRKMRLRIATALSTWDDPRAVSLIERLLAVGDDAVRLGAARALVGQTSPEAVPVLLSALDLDYGEDEGESRAPEIQAALLLHAGRTYGDDARVAATLADFDRFAHDSVRFVAAAMAASRESLTADS